MWRGSSPKDNQIQLSSGKTITFDKLVLATGSKPNKFGWPGQDAKGVHGMVSYQDLQALEASAKDTKQAVIVGGGLIGVEMAEMLLTRGISVKFLVREKSFWSKVLPTEESTMINDEIRRHGVDLRLGDELDQILTDDSGRARAVLTKKGEEIPCQLVGLTAGVSPNIDLAPEAGLETNRGYLVNEYLQTSHPDIFAVGDCAERRKPESGRLGIEAVWYTGKLMAPVLARNICGTPTVYKAKTWFNSAKFFDIEWQTYGAIQSRLPDEAGTFYWKSADDRILIRVQYEQATNRVLGVNTMGVRLRQEVCAQWIDESWPLRDAVSDMTRANFDPEFYRTYESDIIDKFNKAFCDDLKPPARGFGAALRRFLKPPPFLNL